MHADVELALTREGRMLAIRARIVADLGGYLMPTTAMPPHTAAMLMCGVYRLAAADIAVSGRRTNKVPTGPYRGAGRPEAAYFVERIVDDAARELGIDPVELRRRNLVTEFPHETPLGWTYDSGDYERCLDRALELVRPERSEDDARIVATGVGMYVERSGGQFESAEIERAADGTVTIRSSASPHGQGHATTFAQIAAERLGIDVSAVTMEFGDSALVPAGTGTFASRSVAMAGSAIVRAIEDLEASEDGRHGSARFESPLVFASGAYAAVVEIERATGRLRVLRIAAVDDAGTIVNPLLAEGQVLGGTAQGLGECLFEEAALRRGGPVHERFVPRLQPHDRRRDAAGRDGLRRVALAAEPARRQGHRRGRGDRHAGRGGERDRRGARGRTRSTRPTRRRSSGAPCRRPAPLAAAALRRRRGRAAGG